MNECDHIVGFNYSRGQGRIRMSLHNEMIENYGNIIIHEYECIWCPECGKKLKEQGV